MNKFFLIQMFLAILQSANFTWAIFFASSPFTIMFAGVVLVFLCFLAFNAWERN